MEKQPRLILPDRSELVHLGSLGSIWYRKRSTDGADGPSVMCKSSWNASHRLQFQYEVLSLLHSTATASGPTKDGKSVGSESIPIVRPLRLSQDLLGYPVASEEQPLETAPVQGPSLQTVLEMEDCQGRTLRETFLADKGGPVSLSVFFQLALQLARALELIHDCNLIHRDLQPSTIMVRKTNEETGPFAYHVQIFDFQHCLYVDQHSTWNLVAHPKRFVRECSSLPYRSPEETGRMVAMVNYRTDFYSLGVLLYELLCGQLPFQVRDPLEWIHSHLAKTPAPLHTRSSRIPRVISHMISKLMQKSPELRYQSAKGLSNDLYLLIYRCLNASQATSNNLSAAAKIAFAQSNLAKLRIMKEEQILTALQSFEMPLGTQDQPLHDLQLARRYIAREREREDLLRICRDVLRGDQKACIVTVRAEASTGVTRLITELLPRVQGREHAIFACGHYGNQAQHRIPYGGFREAFANLLRDYSHQGHSAFELVRGRFQQEIGPVGQIMLQIMIPELSQLAASRKPLTKESVEECVRTGNPILFRKAFFEAWHTLVNIFTENAGIVIFLDDFQWADEASINLVEMLAGAEHNRMLIILALKGDRASEPDPLMKRMLEAVEEAPECKLAEIVVRPFETKDTRKFISDLLEFREEENATASQQLTELAEYLHAETRGNVGVLEDCAEELVRTKLIQRRQKPGTPPNKSAEDSFEPSYVWTWDLEAIASSRVAENATTLSVSAFEKLSPECKRDLAVGAVIGSEFNLFFVAKLTGKSIVNCAASLQPALASGVISCRTVGIQFLSSCKGRENTFDGEKWRELDGIAQRTLIRIPSSSVQKRALESIDEAFKADIHYRLGSLSLASLEKENDWPVEVFRITSHFSNARSHLLSKAAPAVSVPIAKIELLYRRAAEAASIISSPVTSLVSHQMVLDLVTFHHGSESIAWQKSHEFLFSTHQSLATLHLYSGNHSEAKKHIRVLEKNTPTLANKLSLLSREVECLLLSAQFDKALEVITAGAEFCGVQLPKKEQMEREVAARLGAIVFSELLDTVERDWVQQDKPKLAASDQSSLELTTISLVLMYAKATGSASMLCWAAMHIFGKLMGIGKFHSGLLDAMVVLGQKLSVDSGEDVLRKLDSILSGLTQKYSLTAEEAGRVGLLRYQLLPIGRGTSSNIQTVLDGVLDNGQKSGSMMLFAHSAIELLTHQMEQGQSLGDILSWTTRFHRVFFKNVFRFETWKTFVRTLEYLTAPSEGKAKLEKPSVELSLPIASKWNALMGIVFGITLESLPQETNDNLQWDTASQFFLTYKRAKETSQTSCDDSLKQRIEDCIQRLKRAVKYGGELEEIEMFLLLGERGRLLDNEQEALEYFELALNAAGSNCFMQAQAHESLLRYWKERGGMFSRYQKLSYCAIMDAYTRWGSIRNVESTETTLRSSVSSRKLSSVLMLTNGKRMSKRDEVNLGVEKRRAREVSGGLSPNLGSSHRLLLDNNNAMVSSSLDMLTMMKATQALASETSTEKVVADLMHHLVMNAGADSGILLLKQPDDGQFQLQARFSCKDGENFISVLQGVPVDLQAAKAEEFPVLVLRHVSVSEKSMILNRPFEHPFNADPYLKQNGPQSVLCVPLHQKGSIFGLVYLENNVLSNAFVSDRMEVVRSIGVSLAMALENARLTQMNEDLETALQIVSRGDTLEAESPGGPKYVFDGPIQKAMDILNNLRRLHPELEVDTNFIRGLLISGKSLFASNLETIKDQKGNSIDTDMKDWLRDTVFQPNYQSAENKVTAVAPAKRTSISRRLSNVTLSHLASRTRSSVDRQRLEKLLDNYLSLNFDIFELYEVSGGCPITVLGPHMLIHSQEKLADAFQMDHRKIRNFFSAIDQKYNNNPYHNSKHGADVMQSIMVLLSANPELYKHFTKLELLAAIIAGCIHDTDHPGVNNNHLIETKAPLAVLYSDQSVLEYHHLAVAFDTILSDKENDIFTSFRPDRYREIRKLIVSMVLSTDMAKHFEYINKFKARIDGGGIKLEDPAERGIVLEIAIKCADLNNPTRETETAKRWTDAIMNEFYSQGDIERALGLPVSKFMDRLDPNVAKCQIGFIDFLVMPLYELWRKGTGDSEHNLQRIANVASNRKYWDQQQASEKKPEEKAPTAKNSISSASPGHRDSSASRISPQPATLERSSGRV